MQNRHRLYRRKKGGMSYAHDSQTGKQESLGTRDRAEATTPSMGLRHARSFDSRQET
jgi:hypothetical protein